MIQRKITVLNDLWADQKFAPDAVYRSLSSVLFPAGRPEEIFFYEQTISATAMTSGTFQQPFSVATLLVDWVQKT